MVWLTHTIPDLCGSPTRFLICGFTHTISDLCGFTHTILWIYVASPDFPDYVAHPHDF
jgi:hypothetical protein